AVFLRGLGLVETGQSAVVPLVEPPVLGLGNPQPPAGLQREVQRLDRAGLQRGEGASRQEAGFRQQFTCGARFGYALLGQVDVPPAGEAVLEVPLALAVAD